MPMGKKINLIADSLCHAQYTPAIQPTYLEFLGDARPIRTAGRLERSDLNMFSEVGLFQVQQFLLSAAHIVRAGAARSRLEATLKLLSSDGVIDSGGFQMISGLLDPTDEIRQGIARLSERFECAMILDAPTSAIMNPRSLFDDFGECLPLHTRERQVHDTE
jgi:hypothetical protein